MGWPEASTTAPFCAWSMGLAAAGFGWSRAQDRMRTVMVESLMRMPPVIDCRLDAMGVGGRVDLEATAVVCV